MAEVVVEIVLNKLADVIVNEAKLLGGVGTKVEQVQHELTRIKCYLEDADSKREGDERVQNWLNELRDVAYRIEDAIENFFLHVEDLRRKYPRFMKKIVKFINKPLEMRILYKLGNELDDIQNLLKEISKSSANYGIVELPVRMPVGIRHPVVDETEVVGMEADKKKILELLSRDQTPRRAVITIVGQGGLGKTTLAHMVYKSARADFDYHVMLSISQQFSLTDLLKNMLPKDSTRENQTVENETVGDLINKLRSFLSTKRYLIILDDVWQDELWNQLKDALPDVNNGSRVLMTSRIIDVATSADSQMKPYELKYLDDRESLDLLLKKALPYQEPTQKYPTDLLNLAEKLSKKCRGLPLGLVVLGGILSTKKLSYVAWERVLQRMNWYLDDGNAMRILAMSYEDMPYYLKACFQYLASFPNGYVISAICLIRMWVVEGFIPLAGRPTIDIMAEGCLEELSERSMIQVLNRSVKGLIKHIQVPTILRELAMHEARHENFVTVFSYASNDTKLNKIVRRASLQAEVKNSQFLKYVGQNTHSLFLFDTDGYCRTGLHCSNFRLLKVLEITGSKLDQFELKSLDKLIYLKYLGLRRWSIDLSSCSFHHMKRLETLDVRESIGLQPCDDFWSISTLRHVQGDLFETFFDRPLPIATDLRNIQTLKWVTFQRSFDVKLPNLRTLGIRNETNEWVSITNLLQTLPVLVSLGISAFGYALPMEIIYPKRLPNYQNLQSLYLDGEWPKNVNVEARLLPPHLVKLTLEWSLLNHNPMPELGKLNSLKKLRLRDVFLVDWEGPIICPEGFPVLQYLTVSDTYIKELAVAQGVMPKLTNLQVEKITMVHLPPELQRVIETL